MALFNKRLTGLVDVLAGVTLQPSVSPSSYTYVRVISSKRVNIECVALTLRRPIHCVEGKVENLLFSNPHLEAGCSSRNSAGVIHQCFILHTIYRLLVV